MGGHTAEERMTHMALSTQSKQKKSEQFKKEKKYTKNEVNVMIEKKVKKAIKQKKESILRNDMYLRK